MVGAIIPPPPEPKSLFSGDYCPDVPSSPPSPDPESLFSGDYCPDVGGRFRIWDKLSIGASSISMAASAGLLASEGEDALLLEARFVLDVEIGLG